jgi:hypothetical protein
MTYREWMAARQMLTEEHLGVYLRQRHHQETESFKNTASALSKRR